MNSARFRRKLLDWFDRHQRDLPWRHDRDPYHVWVSEVMLQQTTVAAVIPHYKEFLQTFPTVRALADANEQDVLKHWQGLGYYRRARHLHRAAKMLCEASGDFLSQDPEVWRALPGVGRYILGAVLSQAFNKPMPIVEANSLRVLCRLFAQSGDPKSSAVQRWLWKTAKEMVPAKRPGDFNQAMMELGAVVCTPSRPRCGECPVRDECAARAAGLQDRIPLKTEPIAATQVREVAIIVRRNGRILFVQRQQSAIRWAGMWEFPRGELRPRETHESAARRVLRTTTGIEAKLGPEIATIRHTVTRFRIALSALDAQYVRGRFASDVYSRGLWLRPAELKNHPASTPQRRLEELAIRKQRHPHLF